MNRNPDHSASPSTTTKTGALYAIFAYSSWGLLPIYWKFFGQIPPIEVLSHRIIWSMVFLTGLLLLQRRRAEFAKIWRSPTHLSTLFLTASLLTFNWGLYIYAVNADRVVETSLGYFINPLVNVLLGFVFLKEQLNRWQTLAVVLAGLGVANFIWQLGEVPWIALVLAFSFACYGLLRKVVPVAPMAGLAMETLLVTPIALAATGYWAATGTGHFGTSWATSLLFIGAGVTTSLPLLWFNNAAKRLRLSTLGFFQYLAPSLQLVLALWLYREPFTLTHAITFGLIWTALILYSTSSLMSQRAS
ncbi:EamA family transporter RarD [Leptolyngbya sp. FACHB-541]|uniref:EamA family transporter RarD n=1 Tax=Leptolyngbya sp. FACHB-541 TaxID=2692810 RepID=UPI0016844E0F|nr:EamA family transporter RarD [Leptolyngbya sp. FACHB-541]MBD2000035.1 EamA family transporter RarD [Leptolyngbya sp. FACHB-541]